MTGETAQIPDQVRQACAWVAGRARLVQIDESAIESYASSLPASLVPGGPDPTTELTEGDRETRAAFAICLNAINFGSGWWPTIRKRPGLSGSSTMAAGIVDRFRAGGPWTAAELTQIGADEVAATLGQDRVHPLMAQFAAALRDVGNRVSGARDGSFSTLVDSASGSAQSLVSELASWDSFADASTYEGREVPFYKRAQLATADLKRAGVASFPDIGRLTAFADNLVPHVLRVDGVLHLDPALTRAIEAEELLDHGSPEEVELRACAVQAVELLATASPLTPAQIDSALWNRGRATRYKTIPRPRCRNRAY